MLPGSRRLLNFENVNGIIVVSFVDSKIVTEDQVQELSDELHAFLEDGAKRKILINFGRVQHCSSTVLGKLLALKRRIDSGKGKLKLCCIHPELMAPFKLTGLNSIFEIYSDEQSALDQF